MSLITRQSHCLNEKIVQAMALNLDYGRTNSAVKRTILNRTVPLLNWVNEALQLAIDAWVGTGDGSQSPVLRLVCKLAPELLRPT